MFKEEGGGDIKKEILEALEQVEGDVSKESFESKKERIIEINKQFETEFPTSSVWDSPNLELQGVLAEYKKVCIDKK